MYERVSVFTPLTLTHAPPEFVDAISQLHVVMLYPSLFLELEQVLLFDLAYVFPPIFRIFVVQLPDETPFL